MSISSQSEMGANKWLILMNVMIGTFMAVLDSTVVNTGLPVMMGTLGTSINTAEWILNAYLLAMASILPAAAWLADRFGFKKIYLLSIIVFTFGSFMCGNSDSINELIFWRVIEGLGCGAIMPVGMAIITNAFPIEQRGLALGFWSIASATSISFGPWIGGFIVDNLNWNYIFFLNVPVGIICIFLTIVLQKEYKLPISNKFDVPGFFTSSIFLPLFLYGLSQVNSSTNTQGWSSPLVLGSMWLSAILFILFIFVELRSDHPIINLRLFKDKIFLCSNIIFFVFGIAMFGSTFLVPLYLQDNLGYTATQAGMTFIPRGIIQGIISPIAGRMSQKIDARILIFTGLILMIISFYMNTQLSFLTTEWFVILFLCLRGAGMGILFTPLLTISLNNIKKEFIADASGLTNIVRQIGGSVGIAVFSFMLTTRTTYHTQRYSEQIDFSGETYHQTIGRLTDYIQHVASASLDHAEKVAEQLIIKHVELEGNISGMNDDNFIAYWVLLLALIPAFWLKISKNK